MLSSENILEGTGLAHLLCRLVKLSIWVVLNIQCLFCSDQFCLIYKRVWLQYFGNMNVCKNNRPKFDKFGAFRLHFCYASSCVLSLYSVYSSRELASCFFWNHSTIVMSVFRLSWFLFLELPAPAIVTVSKFTRIFKYCPFASNSYNPLKSLNVSLRMWLTRIF